MLTKTTYTKHPLKVTPLGQQVLRARMSVRETQAEFAKRFMVTPLTVHNWETGRTERIQPIHKQILAGLTQRLKQEGIYMPDDAFSTLFRTELERRGNVG